MKEYESTKESNYLMYLDANNLDGWTTSHKIPYADFKWGDTNIDLVSWKNLDYRNITEGDLAYPKELHDLHKDFPLAAENMKLLGSAEPKLLTRLYNKKIYVLPYRNLNQNLSLGMKLTHSNKANG